MAETDVRIRITADSSGLRGELRDSSGQVRRFSDEMERGGKKASRSLDQASTSAGRMEQGLRRVALQAFASAAALVSIGSAVRIFRSAADEARAFEVSLQEINTLLSDTQPLSEYEAVLKRSLSVFGGDVQDQARGLYQAISAGASSAAEATEVLDQANKLAIGGLTSIGTATTILSQATNAYGREVLSAEEVSDALFVAMKGGITTIDELASSMGQVIPIAKLSGVSFDEVAAAVSAVTAVTGDTRRTVTGLRGAFEELIRAQPRTVDALNELGFAVEGSKDIIELLTELGLADFLAEVEQRLDATGGSITDVFRNSQSLVAILNLTGEGAQRFRDRLADMEEKAGETEIAFGKLSNTMEQRLTRAQAQVTLEMIELGNAILEKAIPTIEFLAENFENIIDVIEVLIDVAIARLIIGLVNLAGQKALNIALAAQLSAGWVNMGRSATVASTGAALLAASGRGLLALIGGPVGLIALSTTASYILGTKLVEAANKASRGVETTEDKINRLVTAMDELEGASGLTNAIERQRFALRLLGDEADEIRERIENLRGVGGEVVASVGGDSVLEATIQALIDKLDELQEKAAETRDRVLFALNRQAGEQIDSLVEELDSADSEGGRALAINELRNAANFASPVFERFGITLGDFVDELEKAGEASGISADALAELRKEATSALESLQEQVETFGLTGAALREYQADALAAELRQAALKVRSEEVKEELLTQADAIQKAARTLTTLERNAEDAERAQEELADDASALVEAYNSLQQAADPVGTEVQRLNVLMELAQREGADWEKVLRELGFTAEDGERALELLAERQEELLSQDARQIEETVEALEREIIALEGGEEALREYNLQKEIEQYLNQAGIDLTRELTDAELEQAVAIEKLVRQRAQLNEELGKTNQLSTITGRIGSNFASAIIEGDDILGSLGRSLRATGGEAIVDDLAGVFDKGLQEAFSGLELDDDAKAGLAAGFALALGSAIEGDIVAASLTAAGTAIGAFFGSPQAGAAIGSLLGQIFGGGSVPKFQVRGTDPRRADDTGTDARIVTALAEIEFGFREIEDEAKTAIIGAFRDFDATMAGIIRDEGQLDLIEEELRKFGVSSRADGESIEVLLQLRFDAILSTFDEFTQEFVKMAGSLEEQAQRLADRFAIQNQLLLGRGFGLSGDLSSFGDFGGGVDLGEFEEGGGGGGSNVPIDPGGGGGGPSPDPILAPSGVEEAISGVMTLTSTFTDFAEVASDTSPILQQTLLLLDDLAVEGESLQETFARLSRVTNTLDTALTLTGGSIADSREELVRFGADLVALFGDDSEAFANLANKVFEAFFSEEERALAAIDQGKPIAESLIRTILAGVEGLDFSEDFLTATGFKELLDLLLSGEFEITPEQVAQLFEAGGILADVIDAERVLAEARGEQVEAIRDAAGIAELFADLDFETQKASLSGFTLELFNLNNSFDELRNRLIELGATEEELADLEARRAAAQRDLLAAETDAFLREVGGQALQSIAPARLEFARLTQQLAENEARARELGLTEGQLQIVRLSAQIQIQGFINSLSASIASLVDQLFGAEDAADGVGGAINRNINNMRDAWLRAIDQIKRALDDQLIGNNTSLLPREQLNESLAQFREALAAAEGGDVDAAQNLPRLFNQAIAQAAGFFGTSTDEFANIEAQLRAALESATLPVPPESPEQQTATNTADMARRLREVERNAFQQLQQAFQLVNQIGILSGLTEDSPAEIAAQFGIPLAQLMEILTGETPDAIGEALESEFNELVANANEQLNQMAGVERLGRIQANLQQDMVGLLGSILVELGGEGPSGADRRGDLAGGGGTPPDRGDLLGLASGGIVTGPTPALIGEGGEAEAVIPLSRISDNSRLEALLTEVNEKLDQANADRREGFELVTRPLEGMNDLRSESLRIQRGSLARRETVRKELGTPVKI